MADIISRKIQHIKLALDDQSQGEGGAFANVKLPYKSLPELDLVEVDTKVDLLGKKLNQPLIIGSMTGGADHAVAINTNLAIAAEECKVAMGVGSQRAALEKPEMRETFELVRKYAPTTVIFANMGLVQLNFGRSIEDYKRVVEMVQADGLYVHVNPIQEALQPEGDTNFSGLMPKFGKLVKAVGVPVFVKEVGGGLDELTVKQLVEMGAAGIDVAGVGGTSWTWIEAKRSGKERFEKWFADFGLLTEEAVIGAAKVKGKAVLVASGGIRNPIQGLKAHLVGADLYSAARPFLMDAIKSSDDVVSALRDWERGLKIAMFGCGMKEW